MASHRLILPESAVGGVPVADPGPTSGRPGRVRARHRGATGGTAVGVAYGGEKAFGQGGSPPE